MKYVENPGPDFNTMPFPLCHLMVKCATPVLPILKRRKSVHTGSKTAPERNEPAPECNEPAPNNVFFLLQHVFMKKNMFLFEKTCFYWKKHSRRCNCATIVPHTEPHRDGDCATVAQLRHTWQR